MRAHERGTRLATLQIARVNQGLARGTWFGAATAAIVAAWTFTWIFAHSGTAALAPPNVASDGKGDPLPAQPLAFAQRFPDAADLRPSDANLDAQVKRARDRLARDMLAQTQVAVDDSRSGEQAPAVKTPLPRARPLASRLMADYGAAGNDPAQTAPPTKFDVSSALKNVFAMLQAPGIKLASAAPDGGISGDGQDNQLDLSAYGKQTAVYDISARTVYMPDGRRLEAHSGLGDLLDDPRYINVHDRGATPPNLYELSLREKPFFGVQALRLKPVGSGDLFGRSGLLAHSYLMGPTGDSNGCVSFKDYNAFLQAFEKGDVKRLVVVRSIATEPVREAGKA
jgi:Protein of unknown function (DUF2778)